MAGMRIRVAYVEEPPFYWTAEDGTATGADIELAGVVLRAIGATSVEFRSVAFDELLPGVDSGRWRMNVPIFVTPDRSRQVAFSRPVWALRDGLLVRRDNPKSLDSYRSIAARSDARLGIIPGQVQVDAARVAGVGETQLRAFPGQSEALAALVADEIDAFAATAVGNRAVTKARDDLESVDFTDSDTLAPVGAFSFGTGDRGLREAVDAELERYLGSSDHRARMATFGIADAEIDGAVATRS